MKTATSPLYVILQQIFQFKTRNLITVEVLREDMSQKHSYGWVKDRLDKRDYIYQGEGKIVIPKAGFWSWLTSLCPKNPTPTPSPTPSPILGSVDLRPQ